MRAEEEVGFVPIHQMRYPSWTVRHDAKSLVVVSVLQAVDWVVVRIVTVVVVLASQFGVGAFASEIGE